MSKELLKTMVESETLEFIKIYQIKNKIKTQGESLDMIIKKMKGGKSK